MVAIPRRKPLKRSTEPIARKRAKPRRGPMRDPGYLQFLREEGTCITRCGEGRGIYGTWCDPAHGPVNGMRSKGPDREAVPLCRFHHEMQTSLGWPAFERRYSLDRAAEAKVWYAAYLIWKEHAAQ